MIKIHKSKVGISRDFRAAHLELTSEKTAIDTGVEPADYSLVEFVDRPPWCSVGWWVSPGHQCGQEEQ